MTRLSVYRKLNLQFLVLAIFLTAITSFIFGSINSLAESSKDSQNQQSSLVLAKPAGENTGGKFKLGGKQINWIINLFKWLYLLLWSVCVICQAILSIVNIANWEVCRKSNIFIQSEKTRSSWCEIIFYL